MGFRGLSSRVTPLDPHQCLERSQGRMEEAEIRGKMKPNSFTFISTSGAGTSLARGKSNRIVVMMRAPRTTKTMENLGTKRSENQRRCQQSFNQLRLCWLLPGITKFSTPMPCFPDRLPAGHIPIYSWSSTVPNNGNSWFSAQSVQMHVYVCTHTHTYPSHPDTLLFFSEQNTSVL